LAGLRRLVLHTRDVLRVNRTSPPAAPDWSYSHQRWTADQVRQFHAMALAQHVLTLVLDCLPSPDVVSADEVAERERQHAAKLAAETAKAEALAKETEQLRSKLGDTEAERDEAVDLRCEAEGEAADYLAKLQRLAGLAKKDVPALVRALLDGEPETADAKV
jgi:hypothetical protein